MQARWFNPGDTVVIPSEELDDETTGIIGEITEHSVEIKVTSNVSMFIEPMTKLFFPKNEGRESLLAAFIS